MTARNEPKLGSNGSIQAAVLRKQPIDANRAVAASPLLAVPGGKGSEKVKAGNEELEQRAGHVLGWVKSGELKLRVEHVFPLSEASDAHRQLEGRNTTGKVLLIP